jgi:RNA polymerase sigma factor (sigma-70 family)
MKDKGQESRAAWVAAKIMPHEAAVRAWLARSVISRDDIDDLIQEAYCRLASLDCVDHISRPDAYFFQTVRNFLLEQLRRSRVARIEAAVEIDTLPYDDGLSAEDVAAERSELNRVHTLIAVLPERCRRIFNMLKIEGVSQREVAKKLGISESIVENEGVRGLRLILNAVRKSGESAKEKSTAFRADNGRYR